MLHGVHRLTGLLRQGRAPGRRDQGGRWPRARPWRATGGHCRARRIASLRRSPTPRRSPDSRQICQSCLDSLGAMVDPLTEPDFDDAHASDPDVVEVYHGTPSAQAVNSACSAPQRALRHLGAEDFGSLAVGRGDPRRVDAEGCRSSPTMAETASNGAEVDAGRQ